jgi:hypothetical protein
MTGRLGSLEGDNVSHFSLFGEPYYCCEFESRSDEVNLMQHYVIMFVRGLVAGRWVSQGTAVSSTNNTDRHDITEILFKMGLNTITHQSTLYDMAMHENQSSPITVMRNILIKIVLQLLTYQSYPLYLASTLIVYRGFQ